MILNNHSLLPQARGPGNRRRCGCWGGGRAERNAQSDKIITFLLALPLRLRSGCALAFGRAVLGLCSANPGFRNTAPPWATLTRPHKTRHSPNSPRKKYRRSGFPRSSLLPLPWLSAECRMLIAGFWLLQSCHVYLPLFALFGKSGEILNSAIFKFFTFLGHAGKENQVAQLALLDLKRERSAVALSPKDKTGCSLLFSSS